METPEKESRHIIVIGETGIGLTESHRTYRSVPEAYREALEATKWHLPRIEIVGIGTECVDRLSEAAKNAEAVIIRAVEAMKDLSQLPLPTPPKMTVGKYETTDEETMKSEIKDALIRALGCYSDDQVDAIYEIYSKALPAYPSLSIDEIIRVYYTKPFSLSTIDTKKLIEMIAPTPKKPKSKTKGWQRPYKYHR